MEILLHNRWFTVTIAEKISLKGGTEPLYSWELSSLKVLLEIRPVEMLLVSRRDNFIGKLGKLKEANIM